MESFSQYSLSNNILKLKKYDKKTSKKATQKSDRIITSIKYLVVQTLHSKSTIVRALLIHSGVHCTIRLVRLRNANTNTRVLEFLYFLLFHHCLECFYYDRIHQDVLLQCLGRL